MVPNTKPVEDTRISLKGLEDFKNQRKAELQQAGAKTPSETIEETDSKALEVAEPVEHVEVMPEPESAEPVVPEIQSELSLDEPPAEIVNNEPTLPEVSGHQLREWWNEFAESQTMRISSLLKSLTPTVRGDEVLVVVPPKKTEIMDSVKFPFARFITEKSAGRLTKMVAEEGEIEETGKRPYTDKEKLEFLLQKHPELSEVIKKLGLFLP